jgi:hypothetical protein
MKGSRVEILLPWMQRSFVEWDLDLDWGFNPVTVIFFVLPVLFVRGVA